MRKEPVAPRIPLSPGKPVSAASSVKSSKPGPYEQVRLEGPDKGTNTIDWGRVKQMSMLRYGGDYCTLSPKAVGPGETTQGQSTASSEGASFAEAVMTPPFSPPSPRTAEATLFEAFRSFHSTEMSVISEAPEDVRDQKPPADEKRQAPIPKPRRNLSNATKPKILPRSDSLCDEEFDVAPDETKRTIKLEEVNQDPFSFPPFMEPADITPKNDSPKKGDFAELHKRFSPFSSREDIFSYEDAPQNEREEPDGAETESDVQPSPLIYENVLFKRRDNKENGEVSQASGSGSAATRDESTTRPDSYRLSTLSTDSPMDEREEWEKVSFVINPL